MCENVNINVSETNETINIFATEVQEVIDINVFETAEDVTLNITEQLIQVNVNKVTASEQIQSDWAQTDNEALDFIKNKPTIPAAVTNTSELINDGQDGVHPFITAEDLPSLTGFVPYTGATEDVDLGAHDLTATQGTFSTSGNPDTLTVTHSSGSGKALTITKGGNGEGIYVNKTSGSGNAVTIIGDLEATNLKRTGGTSSQFLKADGSVDSNTYFQLPSLTSGSVLFSNGTTIAQDNAELFWDDTNNRLGIGTNNPSAYYAKKLVVAAPDEDGITILANSVSSSSYVAFADGATGNQAFRGYLTYKHLSDQLAFGSAGSLRMTIASTGNLLLNTTTDAGFRLDVNGTARFVSDIRSTTGIFIGTTSTFAGVFPTGTAGRESLLIRSNLFVTDAGTDIVFNNAQGDVANLSGTRNLTDFSRGFNPTSGSGVYNVINIRPTINQGVGALGITRGIYIAPTLTSVTDFRAIEVANGITILGASTTAKASLRIPSGTAPTTPTNGDIWFDGTDLKMRIGGVTKTFTLL